MKRLWWIVPVVLLVTGSLLLAGCGPKKGTTTGGTKQEAFSSDLGAFKLTLDDNFQYGEGYQGQIRDGLWPKGQKVTGGDEYSLEITFKASRDLEDALWAGIVDCVTGYWNPLSWNGEDDDDEGTLIAPAGENETYIIKEGEEVVVKATFVALKGAPNPNDPENAYNVLNFQSKGEGIKETAGSGVKKAVDLNITKFVFARTKVGGKEFVPCTCTGKDDCTCETGTCTCIACQDTPPIEEQTFADYTLGLPTTFVNPDNANQIGWDNLTTDTEFQAAWATAKYFVIEIAGGNTGGIGGFQVTFDPGWVNNEDFVSGGWLGYDKGTDVCFIVLEKEGLDTPAGAVEKIIIANYPITDLGLRAVHLVSQDLKPVDEKALTGDFCDDYEGYITKEFED